MVTGDIITALAAGSSEFTLTEEVDVVLVLDLVFVPVAVPVPVPDASDAVPPVPEAVVV